MTQSLKLFMTLCVGILLFTVQAHAASTAEITVTTALDTSGAGDECTLREAIQAANTNASVGGCAAGSNSGADTILFAIPGTGPHTIQLQSALPVISQSVVIDGYSQPGAQANTNPFGDSFNGVLQIVLDGSQVEGIDGLVQTGGTLTVKGLVLNGFNVAIDLSASGFSQVEGNLIGIDVTGMNAAGNTIGVLVGTLLNRIGGSEPALRNVISGNDEGVIIQSDAAFLNTVQGNLIGVNISGTQVVSNTLNGVTVSRAAVNNEIWDNVIAGNGRMGILIQNQAEGTTVFRNWIGVNAAGDNLGNGLDGILARNSGPQIIGSITEGNVIAHNGRSGVGVTAISGVSFFKGILGNRIYDNAGLGIDLRNDGVTENDPGDADGENDANGLQNFPVLETARIEGSTLTITGTLNSTANTEFWLEFFANDLCDPSGYGEGQRYLGIQQDVSTAADGNLQFTVTFTDTVTGLVDLGDAVTATATTSEDAEDAGNTSEFSKCLTVTGADSGPASSLYLPILQRD